MSHEIVVIGTEPPCPRCRQLTDVVSAKVKELGLDARVTHWTFTDEVAQQFARLLGLEPGTAGMVAKKLGLAIDHGKKARPNYESEFNAEYDDYNYGDWTHELDELLRPFELQAKESGVLMTPVLIIDGEVKHAGSVPRMGALLEWLRALQG